MRILFIVLAVCLLLSGCAVPAEVIPDEKPSGFWFGLWNGMTFFFSFIGSLFNENIAVYDSYNKGWLYDLGFLIGASSAFGGSCSAASK